MSVFRYETLLPKNKKVPDSQVIAKSSESGFVLVTKDECMEADWIEDIIAHRARVILLTDQQGGVVHWASALICGQVAWERVLLDNPMGPLTIRINRKGIVTRITGEIELRRRRDHLMTAKIVRAKRSGAEQHDGTYGNTE